MLLPYWLIIFGVILSCFCECWCANMNHCPFFQVFEILVRYTFQLSTQHFPWWLYFSCLHLKMLYSCNNGSEPSQPVTYYLSVSSRNPFHDAIWHNLSPSVALTSTLNFYLEKFPTDSNQVLLFFKNVFRMPQLFSLFIVIHYHLCLCVFHTKLQPHIKIWGWLQYYVSSMTDITITLCLADWPGHDWCQQP